MSAPSDFMLSVLVATGNDRDAISRELPVLHIVLSTVYRQFEIIWIDNGSTDGSQQILLGAIRDLPNLRYIRLTRMHAPEIAATCALEQAIGDVAVSFDPVTDSAQAIPLLVTAASGETVAVARRPRHAGVVRTLAARFFYSMVRLAIGVDLGLNEGSQRAYPRPVLTALTKIKNRRRNLRLFNALIGFPQTLVEVPDGLGIRHERLFDAVGRGIDLLFSNSVRPLRWVSWLGCLAAGLNLLYLFYIFIIAFAKEHVAEGWTTLSTTISAMFFLLFVILAVLAEYVGRILEEVQDRPLYFVEFERDGAVRLGERVINVV